MISSRSRWGPLWLLLLAGCVEPSPSLPAIPRGLVAKIHAAALESEQLEHVTTFLQRLHDDPSSVITIQVSSPMLGGEGLMLRGTVRERFVQWLTTTWRHDAARHGRLHLVEDETP